MSPVLPEQPVGPGGPDHDLDLLELGALVGEAVHEINNAATYLLNNVDILRHDIEAGNLDPDLSQELIEDCMLGIHRVIEVVRHLRDTVRRSPEHGHQVIDLGALLESLPATPLEIDLPPRPVEVMGSPTRLSAALRRLLTAIRARSEGPVRLVLRIEAGEAVLRLRGEGSGFSTSEADVLLRRHFKGGAQVRNGGVGLSVAQAFLSEQDAEVELVPFAEGGSWFEVRMPLVGTRS